MNICLNIVVNNNAHFGKSCIKGTGISVGDILGWLSTRMTANEITADYSELKDVHIRAVLAFVAERDDSTKVAVYETVA